MKRVLYILLLCVAVVSCKKDEVEGSISTADTGLFVENFNESISTKITTSNVGEVSVASTPEGWKAEVSMKTMTLTVTSPENDDAGVKLNGSVSISATTIDGDKKYKIIKVGKVDFVELDDIQANSMVITKPNTFYTFNPNRRGESETEVATKASKCEITWTTSFDAIKYARMMDGGRVGFYVGYDEDDDDEDDDETDIIEANAAVSALTSNGTILWSWHIWMCDVAVSEVAVDDVTFMDRNIGAFKNANSSRDDILASYGLYYQWGRKDPFLYPSSYNAGANYSKPVYNANGEFLTFDYYDSTASKGTIDYTTKNPRNFLTATAASKYDWIYSNGDSSLWGADGEKSIYDPSPKGWRVPSMAELNKLTVAAGTKGEVAEYGAELSGELFMAFGRRVYRDASIQNYAPGDKFTPWSGYYWSCEVAADGADGARQGSALQFYLDESTQDVTIAPNAADYRSTGMQIRPVKM